MLVFSGSSNQTLARRIANKLGVKLGRVELSKFTNDELRVRVSEKKVPSRVAVVQSLSLPTDTHLVEFCLICDALKRKGARDIVAVIPWLGYSKQDKVFRSGEALSVKVIAKMLQVVPLEKVITYDLHNLAIPGFFDVPLINLSGRKLFREYYKKQVTNKTIVVSPDAGATKSSERFAEDLGTDIAYISKKRDLVTGEVSVKGISQSVKGMQVLIKDDMIATGSTLVEAAKFLTKQGVQSIEVAATHHLYVNHAQEKLDKSKINSMVVTDTVEPKVKSKKLKVISVAGVIAKEIKA